MKIDNQTISIDISQSWTPGSVTLTRIEKSAPVLNDEYLWPSYDGKSFYAWGGYASPLLDTNGNPDTPPNDLWRFGVDGQGAGSWNRISVPGTFTRTTHALTAFDNDTAYLLGGEISERTSQSLNGLSLADVSGLTRYVASGNNWTNNSIVNTVSNTNWANGGMMFVPPGAGNNASAGFLAAFGGQNGALIPFDHVSVFDIAGKKWYRQPTSGLIPSFRTSFCTVGVQGDADTFEIFIYGGTLPGADSTSSANIKDLDQVYVLSIPSFTWYQANYDPTNARFAHSCNVIGKRQFVTVGGASSKISWDFNGNTTDPEPQGLGIFDMTKLQWSSSYDANAAAYVTPDMIKKGIVSNGQYPSTWGPGAQAFITGSNATSTSSSNNATTAGQDTASSSSSIGGGAIAGIVIGAVAVLLIIAGGFFLWQRRRRAAAKGNGASDHNPLDPYSAAPTYQSGGYQQEYKDHQAQQIHEAPLGPPPRTELDGGALHSGASELPSRVERRHELG